MLKISCNGWKLVLWFLFSLWQQSMKTHTFNCIFFSMVVNFYVSHISHIFGCQWWWHGYKLQAQMFNYTQIHSSLLLLLTLVFNYVLGASRAWAIMGSTFRRLGFKSPSSYLGFNVCCIQFLACNNSFSSLCFCSPCVCGDMIGF